MRTAKRLRGAFAGAVALLTLALSGILAAVAGAAPAALSNGKTSGYPTDAAASTTSTASVIVIIAAIVVTAAVIAYRGLRPGPARSRRAAGHRWSGRHDGGRASRQSPRTSGARPPELDRCGPLEPRGGLTA